MIGSLDKLAIPSHSDELTPAWLTAALHAEGALRRGRVTHVECTPFAVGTALLSQIFRLRLRYEGAPSDAPRQLVAKIPAAAPQNAAVAVAFHFYLREVRFYRHLPAHAELPVPRFFHGAADEQGKNFVLVLEDLADFVPGDQVLGADERQVDAIVDVLAKMHARFWNRLSETHRDWLIDPRAPFHAGLTGTYYSASLPHVLRNFGDRFSPELVRVAERLEAWLPVFWSHMSSGPTTLAHGDARLDNFMFGADGRLAMVDFQICSAARGPYDLGYFMSQSVRPEVRRRVHEAAIRRYHASLLRHGVRGYDFDSCMLDYRRAVLFSLAYPVLACAQFDPNSERARAFGDTFLKRCLTAIEDTGAAELLDRDKEPA